MVPAQAQEATLSFVKLPSLESDYGIESVTFFKGLVQEKMKANIDYIKGNRLYLTLYHNNQDKTQSVNAEMLRHGFAQVEKRDDQSLVKLEELARSKRLGMFEYGDFSLDEE
jgi:staphylococcal nuclease domain-containing protein 1